MQKCVYCWEMLPTVHVRNADIPQCTEYKEVSVWEAMYAADVCTGFMVYAALREKCAATESATAACSAKDSAKGTA